MIPAMQPLYSLASTSSLVLLLSLAACGDKSATDTDETGTGETATETAADDVGESGTATATTTSLLITTLRKCAKTLHRQEPRSLEGKR